MAATNRKRLSLLSGCDSISNSSSRSSSKSSSNDTCQSIITCHDITAVCVTWSWCMTVQEVWWSSISLYHIIIIIIIYPISFPIINLHHIIVLIQSMNEASIYIFLSLYLSFRRLMSDVEYHKDEWWWQLIELIFIP